MTQKVYITKYALSGGIIEMEAEIHECDWGKKGISVWGKFKNYTTGFYNNDFWLTPEEAIADAENRRVKKIASLKKQIAKLEKLTVKIKP